MCVSGGGEGITIVSGSGGVWFVRTPPGYGSAEVKGKLNEGFYNFSDIAPQISKKIKRFIFQSKFS